MSRNNFYINRKKEFIITFPRDFVYLTSKEIVFAKLSAFFDKHDFEYIIGAEHNAKEELHYHIYLQCLKPSGFSTRDVTCFDIELPKRIVSFFDTGDQEYKQLPFDQFNYDEENVKVYLDEDKENIKSYKILHSAHPNIVFKGNRYKDWAKSTVSMIKYVTKEDKEPISNFDWKKLLEHLENKNKKRKYDQVIDDEREFFEWIRLKIDSGMTDKEVITEIKSKPEFFYVYSKNFRNVNQIIKDFFKRQKPNKPIPFIGTYWVSNDLYDYLIYLDNWVKLYHTEIINKIDKNNNYDSVWEKFVKNHPERPKSCYITGPGNCGKTSLIACFKSFSYWCNGWNMNNYELRQSFNLFDDYDGQCGGGNWDNSDFNYLKPWFAGQQIISISGKYCAPTNIKNHKPMVFISNYASTTRFTEENNKYLKEIDCTFINIDKHMKDKPSRWTIGGFAKYREFDFKTTWTYQNLYDHPDENPAEVVINVEPPASLTDNEDNTINLIDSDTEKNIDAKKRYYEKYGWTSDDEFQAELKWHDDGCPTIEDIPRQGQNISMKNNGPSTSNWTPNNCTQTTSGLDGSTNHVFMNKYYDRIIDDINRQIKSEDRCLRNWNSIKHDCKERIDILKRRYENSFNKKWTKWLELSIKDLENIRFNILNEIRDLNDKIIECDRNTDKICDRIESLVEQLIQVYNTKRHTYK